MPQREHGVSPQRPRIQNLSITLGDATEFDVDPVFNEELPLQIHCRSCGAHLQAQWRQQTLTYRHPRERFEWCRAPVTFAVPPGIILREALHAVLTKAPAEPDHTIHDRLHRWVIAVYVEATSYNACGIQVDVWKQGDRAQV